MLSLVTEELYQHLQALKLKIKSNNVLITFNPVLGIKAKCLKNFCWVEQFDVTVNSTKMLSFKENNMCFAVRT